MYSKLANLAERSARLSIFWCVNSIRRARSKEDLLDFSSYLKKGEEIAEMEFKYMGGSALF